MFLLISSIRIGYDMYCQLNLGEQRAIYGKISTSPCGERSQRITFAYSSPPLTCHSYYNTYLNINNLNLHISYTTRIFHGFSVQFLFLL